MFPRALVTALPLSLLLTSFLSAQVSQLTNSIAESQKQNAAADLAGIVLNADGKPAPGVRVELDESSTAIPVASAYTQADGSFELPDLAPGTYEIVASSGDTQVSEGVSVGPLPPPLELRLPAAQQPQYGLDATISVAHYLVPEKARRLYRKAVIEFQQGREDQALTLLENALIIEPEFAEALTLRGYIEMENDELKEAEQYLEHAVRIDPSSPAAFVALGGVYNHEGRFDDALHASERGTSLSPRSWQGYFEMARAAVGKGMYQKALLLARQAERLGGNSFASLHLVKACALYPMKLYKDARYELQAALSRGPKGTSAKQAEILLAQLNAATKGTEMAVASVH